MTKKIADKVSQTRFGSAVDEATFRACDYAHMPTVRFDTLELLATFIIIDADRDEPWPFIKTGKASAISFNADDGGTDEVEKVKVPKRAACVVIGSSLLIHLPMPRSRDYQLEEELQAANDAAPIKLKPTKKQQAVLKAAAKVEKHKAGLITELQKKAEKKAAKATKKVTLARVA